MIDRLQDSTHRPPVTDNERLCTRCSLAPVCLPEEATFLQDSRNHQYFPLDQPSRPHPTSNRIATEFPLAKPTIAGDKLLKQIYINVRFKNDIDRLEKLFDLYTKTQNAPRQEILVQAVTLTGIVQNAKIRQVP
jgi:hypothetical protein